MLDKWKLANPERFRDFELEHIGLKRNGVAEDDIIQLTAPYRLQCISMRHSILQYCHCKWVPNPQLPPGITEHEHRPNYLGPHLKDCNRKRISFHFVGRQNDGWKVGWPAT